MTRKTRSRSRRRDGRGRLGQRIAVGLSGVLLILCAASITYGVFVRQTGADGTVRRLRVAVFNGTGRPGLAHAARPGLERLGVDVIEVGNAERVGYRRSMLVARKRGADVRLLGEMIGCREVVEQLDRESTEDASLILGSDYRDLGLGWGAGNGLVE